MTEQSNWIHIGSLIVTIIIVFGGVFAFLFNAQSNRIAEALEYGSGESQLRHTIQAEQITYLNNQIDKLGDRVLDGERRQAEINMQFTEEHNDK